MDAWTGKSECMIFLIIWESNINVQTNKELGDNREKEAEDLIAEAGLSAENVH